MRNYPLSNLYQVIENNVKKAPNRSMVYEDGLKISNKDLQSKIDSIAEFLLKRGIKPRDKVALVMSNSWQFIANIFAISKIGAIIVPINNFLKEDELAYILNDSQAKLLFSSNKFAKDTKELWRKTDVDTIVWVDGCPLENEKNIDH